MSDIVSFMHTADLARQTATARTGQLVLKAIMATFRQEHQSVILMAAQKAFTTLTGGHYVQLAPRDNGRGKKRSAAAFTVLSTIAENGQAINSTHHQHLLDIVCDVMGENWVIEDSRSINCGGAVRCVQKPQCNFFDRVSISS